MANTTPPNITTKPTTERIGNVPIIVALKATPETNIARPRSEQPRALQPSPRCRRAQPSAPYARGEFRVLGIKSALDLVEHPLLMIGEWHSSLLAENLSR